MFFHLNQARPKSFYLDHGRAVLTMDAPLVLFCDAETRSDLEAIRGDRPTVYVEKPIAEYDYYRTLLPIVRANRARHPCPDPRNTPEYFLVSVFKLYALYLAYQQAETPTTHYAWIDLGCSHVVRDIPGALAPILTAPRPKIACCAIRYRSPRELFPMTSYLANGGPCGLAAGLLTVESIYMSRFFTLANSILFEQLSMGVGHAEEQILIYCFARRPEWFSLYPGDYYSIATNYHRAVQDLECIATNFVAPAIADGRDDLARLPRMRLLVLVISGGDDPIYARHKECWRRYMHATPGVDVYFLEAGSPGRTDDTLTVPGVESWSGILDKTLEALKLLPVHTYTHVLRTNLSSVWNFRRLLAFLDTLPRESLYAGYHGLHKGRIPYISGAGILMSTDVCQRLLAREAEIRASSLPDDVAIAVGVGLPPGPAIPRVDVETPSTPIPPDGIHYRVKMVRGDSRDHEPALMATILSHWTPG